MMSTPNSEASSLANGCGPGGDASPANGLVIPKKSGCF